MPKKNPRVLREEFRRLAQARHPLEGAKLREYIGEAEYQDGEEYWLQFSSAQEALDDFDIFLEEIKE